jgi:hypothetical protein
MSSVNQNYDNSSNYDNGYDSNYDSLNNDIDTADTPTADDSNGSSLGGAPDAATARDELKQLEQQAKSLNPDVRANLLETLHSLEKQLDQIGQVDNDFEAQVLDHINSKMGEVENQMVELTVDSDQVGKNEDSFKTLESNLQNNPYISKAEKDAYQKKIDDLKSSFSSGESDVATTTNAIKELQGELSPLDTKKSNFDAEKTRSAAIGNQLASQLDQVFGNADGNGGTNLDSLSNINILGTIGGGIANIGEQIGGPVAWVTGGVGALLGAETKGPDYHLKNLDPAAQKLDMVEMQNSGLSGSHAPADVVKALYDTSLPADQQILKIQSALADLPPASQAYVMSTVIKLIGSRDPQKLQFLNQNAPEVVNAMKKVIQDGQNDIKSGALAKTGGNGYDVQFSGGNYVIHNNDTAWYRNDWDDFTINTSEILDPMNQALRALDAVPSADGTTSTDDSATTNTTSANPSSQTDTSSTPTANAA